MAATALFAPTGEVNRALVEEIEAFAQQENAIVYILMDDPPSGRVIHPVDLRLAGINHWCLSRRQRFRGETFVHLFDVFATEILRSAYGIEATAYHRVRVYALSFDEARTAGSRS